MTIERSNYSGYLWYSNQDVPQVYDGSESVGVELQDGENPFVAEGFLCDGQTSIAIKYIDGKYVCTKSILSDLPSDYTETKYLSNRMDNRILLFRTYWRSEKDVQCMDMEVLQPAETVFLGFVNEKGE